MSATVVRPHIARVIDLFHRNESEHTKIDVDCRDTGLNEAEMEGLADALNRNTNVEEIEFHGSLIAGQNSSGSASLRGFLNRIFATHPSLISVRYHPNWTRFGRPTPGRLNSEHAACIAEALKTNTSLKKLDLRNNLIGCSGFLALLEGLRANKTLEELILDNTDITVTEEEVVNELSLSIEKSSLRELYLPDNMLGNAGAKAIAMGLQKNKTITALSLYSSGIGTVGLQDIALALRHNDTLCVLVVAQNPGADDDGVLATFEATLRHINYTLEELNVVTEIYFPPAAIETLCNQNRRMKQTFRQINDDLPRIPLGLWPRVLELVECKPDYLFELLKAKPDLCREKSRNSRRRRRPERFGY